jgi:hypothetical protein
MTLTAKQVFPMAYDRATFKNRVMEKIDGALVEYYKAALAELNGQAKWVQHWRSEVERLLFIELHTVLARPIKGRWDRRRAIGEVVAELRAADAGYRRVAEGAIKRYYGLKKITRRLDDEATQRFYAMVEEALAAGPEGA